MDPTPVEMPIGYKRPESLQEQIRRLVRSEAWTQEMNRLDAETFDEADDFDVGEDFDPQSPYELQFDPDLNKEVTREEKFVLDQSRAKFDEFVKEKKKTAYKNRRFKEERPKERKKEAKPVDETD